MPKALLVLLVVAVGGSAGFGYALLTNSDKRPERSIADRPIQIPADGYVSSDSCQACHPSQYASWHGSYHRTMTQLATPESVVASFDNVEVTQVPGHAMRLERRGRELWAELDEPDW